MWGVALILFSCVQAHAMSHGIQVTCRKFHDFLPTSKTTPSFLADLKVEPMTAGAEVMLNISWAVNLDVSVKHLTGTGIAISGQYSYHCEYNPHLAVNVTGSEQKWFHYLVKARCGISNIEVTNLPLPPLGSGPSYKVKTITIPCIPEPSTPVSEDVPPVGTPPSPLRTEHVAVAIFGGLAALMILTLCYMIYKCCGANIATSFGFKRLPQSPVVPVPVLVVYPAENSAFQQAVVALSEFLQWHGGCRVAVDIWQQGKIAELGPMRWLAEQVKSSDQVLIVCPQASSEPSLSPPDRSFPEASIPAAAHDLYPLILNMVASHAKSTSDLAKFWVVQLGEQQDKRHSSVSLELRACKSFCLMKDLNKLCWSVHTHRQDNKKIADLSFSSEISYSEKSTVKLREAVEKLFQRSATSKKCGHLCLSISNEHV
uniref:SEFIR domain-containing protein n=1 Tax=Scophthalmus maximus TaxID=52904 RepID=A0A8D3EBL8_SCOMX